MIIGLVPPLHRTWKLRTREANAAEALRGTHDAENSGTHLVLVCGCQQQRCWAFSCVEEIASRDSRTNKRFRANYIRGFGELGGSDGGAVVVFHSHAHSACK